MNEKQKTYLAIDLKSFYASVECVERGLDPLKTNLVVADASRTDKTICLAVTPTLKAYGLSGRSRLFEVEQKAAEILRQTGKPLEYLVAVPRMSLYIQYSTRIYQIYLKYFSPDDVHVYSIDEVFIDATSYLEYYRISARDLAMKVIQNILKETGITATAGIGTNLYLCKIAMDIVAKHIPADKDGVRIADLNEYSYREKLWNHKPITDFWRVGNGTAARLSKYFMFTMGDIARMSLTDEKLLYKLFGIDAEILIDHAWGYEPCTMKEIKAYKSVTKSLSTGQVLMEPYTFEKARLIVKEMTELLAMDLFKKKLLTSSITLYVGYDRTSLDKYALNNASNTLEFTNGSSGFDFQIVSDPFGRPVPAPSGGTFNFFTEVNSARLISAAALKIYDRVVNPSLYVRRINICANNTVPLSKHQPLLFEELETVGLEYDENFGIHSKDNSTVVNRKDWEKESRMQNARLELIKKFGKNALLKGMNFEDGATTRIRNAQIGGHKA